MTGVFAEARPGATVTSVTVQTTAAPHGSMAAWQHGSMFESRVELVKHHTRQPPHVARLRKGETGMDGLSGTAQCGSFGEAPCTRSRPCLALAISRSELEGRGFDSTCEIARGKAIIQCE
jgi:hypothetical protein